MSSDASATPKVSNVQFDPDGDVILVLQSEGTARTARFQVNSNILCLASSVFRAMLRPNALRSSSDADSPPIEVSLADDDPRALALLLRIVHLQCDWVPRILNDEQLYQVAIVCEKYDMRQALGLWLDYWIPVDEQAGGEYSGDREENATGLSGDQWLFISYALDRETLFTPLSKDLIQTVALVDGSLFVSSKEALWSSLWGGGISTYTQPINPYIPHSIIAEIQARQQEALAEMYSYLDGKVEAYLSSPPMEPQCANSTKSSSCDLFFLGLLQKSLKGLNSCALHQHQDKPERTSRSLQYLKTIVDNLRTPEYISFQGLDISTSGICRCASFPSDNLRMNSTCQSCRGKIINHANTCSPVPAIKLHIGAKYEAIQGLDLGMFRRNKSNISNTVKEGQDLWDYLEYK